MAPAKGHFYAQRSVLLELIMSEKIDNVLLVKVGTDVLSIKHDDGTESLNDRSFVRIGQQIRGLDAVGVVTSAGITAGLELSGGVRPSKEQGIGIEELQALASIGVSPLFEKWRRLALDGRIMGGLLLTRSELGIDKPEGSQTLRTIHNMISKAWVPVINENDAIAHEEITFGDNDILAAELAAQMAYSALFGSVRLVLLSSVHGLYKDPKNNKSVIRVVPYGQIPDYEGLINDGDMKVSNGGMTSKFRAAKIATENGVPMWIANGYTNNAIQKTLDGQIGTHFMAKAG